MEQGMEPASSDERWSQETEIETESELESSVARLLSETESSAEEAGSDEDQSDFAMGQRMTHSYSDPNGYDNKALDNV